MRKLSSYLLVLFFLTVVVERAFPQSNRLLRGEINAKDYDFLYFIPVGENGLITLVHYAKFRSSHDFWRINLYSENLNLLHQRDFQTGPGHKLIEYNDDKDSILYAFFAEKGGSSKYEVLKYNYKKDKIKITVAQGDAGSSYEHFDVLGKAYFVAGIKNPSALAYFGQVLFSFTIVPLFTGAKIYKAYPKIFYNKGDEHKNINLNLKGESMIMASKTNKASGLYSLIVKNFYKNKSSLHYYEFDEEGQMVRHNTLKNLDTKNLLSGELITINDTLFSFVGTYNDDRKHRLTSQKEATGIFVSTIYKGRELLCKFHPFYTFTNAKKALDYFNRKRYEENKRKGHNMILGFNLLMHQDIIKTDSLYLLLAESYYPEYHYETYSNFYGSFYNDQIFDGFRFSNAFATAFDKEGNLVWDNTFDISEIISYNRDENVVAYYDKSDKTVVLLYYFNGFIYSQVIKGNEVLYRKDRTEVRTVNEHENVLYENYGKIYHWYGPYFLLTGYQVVADSHGKKRKVYFFLKIGFE